MGFLKKVFRPVRKIAKKIIPKEIRPALPYIAAFYGGPQMAGSNTFLSGIGNAGLRNAISKGLIAGATAAATDEDANILRTAALAGAPDLLAEGLGNVAGRIDPNLIADSDSFVQIGDTAAKTAGALSRASEGIKAAGALKTIGTQTAIDSAARFAELNQAEIDKYNQSLLSQGMKSKADRRSAIYNIYINTGAYEPDEINSMLDRYGYEKGGLIELIEKFKKRTKAPKGLKGFMKSMEKNNRYSRKEAQPLIRSNGKDEEPKDLEEEEEKVYLTRSADPNYSEMISQALSGVDAAFGRSLLQTREPMRMGFARGGEIEIEEETDDLGIMDFMKDQGIEYGEQASYGFDDAMAESFEMFQDYRKRGLIPMDMEFNEFLELLQGRKEQGIMQMASGYKTDIEEMYEQYVFEMEEMGLEPMSFSQFMARERAGMAKGGSMDSTPRDQMEEIKGQTAGPQWYQDRLEHLMSLGYSYEQAGDIAYDSDAYYNAIGHDPFKDGGKVKRRKKGEPADTGDEEPGPRSFPEFDEDRLFEEKMPQVVPNKPDMMDAAMGGIAHHARRMEAGGLMNRNLLNTGMDKDMRGGGFIPEGTKEKADDVPARLSKNEFVMTADAVRAAGGGSVNQGAKRMYDLMHNLEAKV
jgi:hypothetical protein